MLARIRGVEAKRWLADLRDNAAADEDPLLTRDDLALSYVHPLLDVGEVERAAQVMEQRSFHPFEGGEGQAIAAWDRVVLARAAALPPGAAGAQGRVKVLGGDLNSALDEAPEQLVIGGVWFEVVPNLGEGRHPADPLAQRLVALGDARAEVADHDGANRCWQAARTGGGLLDVAPHRPAT